MSTARAVVTVAIPNGAAYEVTIGTNLADVRQRVVGCPTGVLLVTDSNVAIRHLSGISQELSQRGLVPVSRIVPAGEMSKTPQTVVEVVRAAAANGLDRKSTIIAVGGGVIGDLAGLAAALFMRGIRFVNFPTTLLAMVDAAVGGKTAVDLPEGKNLLGAFHQPAAVVCDIAHLSTLPDSEWRHGLAEVVKTALLGEASFIADLERLDLKALQGNPDLTVDIVRRCVAIKAGVVMRDERESGERQLLNAGHTVGHGLEAASNFTLAHGAAVAIGLVVEARIAEQLRLAPPGLARRLGRVLAQFGLDVRVPASLIPSALARMQSDKKKIGGHLRLALPIAPGDVRVVDGVTSDQIEAALRDMVDESMIALLAE